jgi:capsid protein
MKPNWIESALGTISPSWALQRMVARNKLAWFRYDAGKSSSRDRGRRGSVSGSEASGYQQDRVNMVITSRELVENFGSLKGLILKIPTYVAGKVLYYPNTGDENTDRIYKDYLKLYFRNCDITGRHNFTQQAQLMIQSVLRDGDVGFVLHPGPFGPLLQAIEADRIGGPYNITTTEGFIGGVKVDPLGRPVAYRVFERTASNSYDNPKDIPASKFILCFDPMRFDQYRGVPAFHAALTDIQDIKEIFEFEKIGVKWASAQTGVIQTETGEDNSGFDFDETSTDSNSNAIKTEAIEPGRLTRLMLNEKLASFSSDRPSPAWQGLIKTLFREFANSVDLPYGFLFDLAGLGGPSARMESAQARRTFERWQDNVLVQRFGDPLKNMALSQGIERGDIPKSLNWYKGAWQFPAHPTIDVGRESAAGINENRAGMLSKAKWYGDQGMDEDEEGQQIEIEARKTIRRAKAIANEEDVPFEVALNLLEIRTPNGLTPPQEAPSAPDPEEPEPDEPETTPAKK